MRVHKKDNFYIFTGGPGSGKTSVINLLKEKGYETVNEVARKIIQDQLKVGGNATHTGDQMAFCQLMLEASIKNYFDRLTVTQPVFFDRGIPGLYGYQLMTVGVVSKEVELAVEQYRYNKNIFIFPPWEAIYCHDEERKQDFSEAIETYEQIKSAHTRCGYHIIEVPKVGILERVHFILSMIGKNDY